MELTWRKSLAYTYNLSHENARVNSQQPTRINAILHVARLADNKYVVRYDGVVTQQESTFKKLNSKFTPNDATLPVAKPIYLGS